MDGTIHPYYTVALAPAIAALVGISVRELWRVRDRLCGASRAWRRCRRHRSVGVRPAWTARRTGCPRCGGSCWPDRWLRRLLLAVGAHRQRPGRRGIGRGRDPFRSGRARGLRHRDRRDRAQRTDVDVGSRQGRSAPAAVADRRTGWPGRRMADNAALAELVEGLDNRWAAASYRLDAARAASN